MKYVPLLAVVLFAGMADAQSLASSDIARRAVRAALEARAELPRHLPLFPSAQTEHRVRRSVVPASPSVSEQTKSKGAERAERARMQAAERLETIRGRGAGPSAAERGAGRNARQAKSKEVREKGPPDGRGPPDKGGTPQRGPKKTK